MYVEMLKTFLSAIFFRSLNIFGMRAAIAYVLLSSALIIAKPEAKVPEKFILYAATVFIAYIAAETIRRRLNGNKTITKNTGTNATNIFFPIFSIAYMIGAAGIGKATTFAVTWAVFIIISTKKYNGARIWFAVAVLSFLHAIVYGRSILYPALYGASYIFVIRFFGAARDAFSIAYKPGELREGMTPAETIVFDGKKYIFTTSPFPSLIGLFRYGTDNIIFKRRVVASLFSPLKKENIHEIIIAARKYKKPVIFVQKKADFLPFLVLGAIITYALS